MNGKLKVALGVIVGSLMLLAGSYCYPKTMFAIAAFYGVCFFFLAICFVGGMLNMGIRETSQTRRRQPCG